MSTWKDFMRELEEEVAADGPEAVIEHELMGARFAIAAAVEIERRKRKLTQQALAKACGLDQAEISRIEKGVPNPTLSTLVRVLATLGLRIAFEKRPDVRPPAPRRSSISGRRRTPVSILPRSSRRRGLRASRRR